MTRLTAILALAILAASGAADLHAVPLPRVGLLATELIVSLRTASAVGLTIPQSILLRADEVIQ